MRSTSLLLLFSFSLIVSIAAVPIKFDNKPPLPPLYIDSKPTITLRTNESEMMEMIRDRFKENVESLLNDTLALIHAEMNPTSPLPPCVPCNATSE